MAPRWVEMPTLLQLVCQVDQRRWSLSGATLCAVLSGMRPPIGWRDIFGKAPAAFGPRKLVNLYRAPAAPAVVLPGCGMLAKWALCTRSCQRVEGGGGTVRSPHRALRGALVACQKGLFRAVDGLEVLSKTKPPGAAAGIGAEPAKAHSRHLCSLRRLVRGRSGGAALQGFAQ